LLFVIALVLGLYTFVQTKFPWYIMLAYPALSILSAAVVVQALKRDRSMAFASILVSCALASFMASPKIVLGFSAAPAIAIVGAAVTRWRPLLLQPFAVVSVLFLVACAVGTLPSNYRKGDAPIAKLGRMAAGTASDSDESIVVSGKPYGGKPGPALMYYSDHPVDWAETEQDLAKFVRQGQLKVAVVGESDLGGLSQDYKVKLIANSGKLDLVQITPCSTH
jgi:hypothetical protein